MGKPSKEVEVEETKSGSDEEAADSDDESQGSGSEEADENNHEEVRKDNTSSTKKSSSFGESSEKQEQKQQQGGNKFLLGDKFLAQTENFNVKLRKRGVIYVSRIPPRMTPTKLKTLLSEFGEVTRVYLVEEDKTARQRRRKNGGSGAKRYTEGWVEFAKKRIAKHVALNLNNTPISNYKRSAHYGDLWNLKYLPKFKWSHLTEKVAYERRVREQKLRVEMMQARRENASYVELVETGKKLDKIEERKRKRMEKDGNNNPVFREQSDENNSERKQKKGKHRQNKPLDDRTDSAAKKALLRALVQD